MSRSNPALVVSVGSPSAADKTVRLLDLARLQIDDSLAEADRSVEAMLGTLLDILAALGELSESGAGALPEGTVERLRGNATEVVESMQFYDRLTQRLGHLRNGLAELAEVFAKPCEPAATDQWTALQERIRAMYGNEPDRRLFDAVMSAPGSTGDLAPPPADTSGTGGLELF